MLDWCYLCGATEKLTRDHIPPSNLFPDPKPTNLITVSCCKSCNEGFSKDDEAFRFWVSTSMFRSGAGEWIWQNKVVPSLFERNRKLAQNARSFLGFRKLAAGGGEIELPALGFPRERVERYMIRITKGLLRHFHPEYDYSQDVFDVKDMLPSPEGIELLRRLTEQLPLYEERGDGVFRFWRGFPQNRPNNGAWIFLFYNGACFFVLHGKNLSELKKGSGPPTT